MFPITDPHPEYKRSLRRRMRQGDFDPREFSYDEDAEVLRKSVAIYGAILAVAAILLLELWSPLSSVDAIELFFVGFVTLFLGAGLLLAALGTEAVMAGLAAGLALLVVGVLSTINVDTAAWSTVLGLGAAGLVIVCVGIASTLYCRSPSMRNPT